jgi:hypothetical protein
MSDEQQQTGGPIATGCSKAILALAVGGLILMLCVSGCFLAVAHKIRHPFRDGGGEQQQQQSDQQQGEQQETGDVELQQ